MTSFEEYKNLGNTHYQAKEYDLACTYYEKALAVDSTNAVGHSNLAMALIKLGKHCDALAQCELGLQCKPSDKIEQKLLWRMSTAREELFKQSECGTNSKTNSKTNPGTNPGGHKTVDNNTVEIPIVEVDSLPLEYQ